MTQSGIQFRRLSLALAVALATLLAFISLSQVDISEGQSGADLTAEIALNPAVPEANQSATVRVTVRNRGTASASGGFYVYLYVNPTDQPPNPGTPNSYFWFLPSLGPGASSSLERSVTFPTTGCGHKVYAWVDRDNTISESNDNNNLVMQTVCVGVTCQPDTFEQDNTCGAAQWITVGISQTHTYCPVGDEDWVRLNAVGGVTYTIEATNLGAHADPILSLYPTCSGLSQFGTGPRIDWVAPASGVYYIQSRHRAPSYGPLSQYDLKVTTSGSHGDVYEPDGNCTVARDIPTDGTRQTHRFQAQGDEDWVRFTIGSGANFSIVADNTGQGVQPLISLYNSCGQTFGTQVAQGTNIIIDATTPRTYYAKVVNQNAGVFGPTAVYDLRVTAIPCAPDDGEDDDSQEQAKTILTTGAPLPRNTCGAGDEDWLKFEATAGTTYVIQTTNLGIAGDTELYLFDTDGTSQIAHNDDFGYAASSRIVWQASGNGTYYIKAKHHNPNAAGPDTRYDIAVSKGRCTPDTADAADGDNNFLQAATIVTNGQPVDRTFCPDPQATNLGDQDWLRFQAVGGQTYHIQTQNLGPNSDTVLTLYDRDGVTPLATNDDHSEGRASQIQYTVPADGTYFVRVTHYNASFSGSSAEYQVAVSGQVPPTPTPTPTPSPTPSPTPRPTPIPSEVKTLIVVNLQRMVDLYGSSSVNALLGKLYDLADHARVKGLVLQLENDASVAAAYATWTASQDSLLNTLTTNNVTSAIRNRILATLDSYANVEYVVLIGSDPVIPHRREPEGNLAKKENEYASSVTPNTTLWAACRDNMVMTDDYYVDRVPTEWQPDKSLYIPDFAISRLIETPEEIGGFIDMFLAGDTIPINRALVTGYDFVQDGGTAISAILQNDTITTDASLIGFSWPGDALRQKHLSADPRFDLHSINGHSTHDAVGTPNEDDILASEIVSATTDFERSLVFAVGCHAGFNDSGSLDLAQAFMQRKVNYVGNTGYGWGGGGVVYTEALMRNYLREMVRDTVAEIGPSLMKAKQRYYQQAALFGPYDAKVLMQAVLYGLPMFRVTSGGTLTEDDPFPSADISASPPTAFGAVSTGRLEYGLPGSFGAFGETEGDNGSYLALDGNMEFSGDTPIQPRLYANVSAPNAGRLHGAVFLGGVYTDVTSFDPVIALPYNEYVEETSEPSFAANGWYPAVPFQVRSSTTVSSSAETLVTLLGQFNSDTDTERVFGQMAFDTFYSNSADTEPATVLHVDGVLNESTGLATLKVEAADPSGILRVVVAYTAGGNQWQSRDLAYSDTMLKWTGHISATVGTMYFVQVVDGAGNVATDDNKGAYHGLAAPIPLARGQFPTSIYLPMLRKGEDTMQ